MAVDYQIVLWDPSGKPYWGGDGQKHYIPPITAAQMDDTRAKAWATSQGASADPEHYTSGAPGQSLLKNRGTWNTKTGNYDQGTNWSAITSMAIAGVLTGGAISAVGGGGAAGGAGAASAASGAGTGGGVVAGGTGLGSTVAGGLLKYGLPVAGSIYAARSQANAEKDAAQLQSDFNNKALAAQQEQQAWERQQALDAIKRQQEDLLYTRAQTEENQTYNRGERSQYLTRLDPFRSAGQGALPRIESLLSGGGAGMVTMRAPTGETQAVHPVDVDRATQLGAVRI